jgi:hypothetical protein
MSPAELIHEFLAAVSFEPGGRPDYERIRTLFVETGRLNGETLDEFIAPRAAAVERGELTEFSETEEAAIDEAFGNVAHRTSTYAKRGVRDGAAFSALGLISTQFVRTPDGWRMTSMIWDDERDGLELPERYRPD